MDKRIKKKWVKALKSRLYTRGVNALCTENVKTGECKFCCLGVLCELYINGNKKNKDTWQDEGCAMYCNNNERFLSFKSEELGLPEEVSDWAKLNPDAKIYFSGQKWDLEELNDIASKDHKFGFSRIADLIDKQL